MTAGSVPGGDGFRAGLWAGAAPNDRTSMGQAQRTHGYTLAEIAAAAGCHYSTVSKIIRALETNSRRKT